MGKGLGVEFPESFNRGVSIAVWLKVSYVALGMAVTDPVEFDALVYLLVDGLVRRKKSTNEFSSAIAPAPLLYLTL